MPSGTNPRLVHRESRKRQKSRRVLPIQITNQATEVVLQSMPQRDSGVCPSSDIETSHRNGLTESLPQRESRPEHAIMGLTASIPPWDLQDACQHWTYSECHHRTYIIMPARDLHKAYQVGQTHAWHAKSPRKRPKSPRVLSTQALRQATEEV